MTVALMLLPAACTSSHPTAAHPSPSVSTPPVYQVGARTTVVTCGKQPTIGVDIWYPAVAAGIDTAFADGSWPVVVFSHGLELAPSDYVDLLQGWTAAGFVVVAPTYPYTASSVPVYRPEDAFNQPADAACVLTAVLADSQFHDHLDADRIAAAGHSAGGQTVVGEFSDHRDPRLKAGIVLAGALLKPTDVFTGSAAPILFVHGDADPRVPYAEGMTAYGDDPWPKGFLTLIAQNHLDPYLDSQTLIFAHVLSSTTDFLRWSLNGDLAAKARLAADAVPGGRLQQQW